jgi:hypothetical protein
MYCIFQGRGIVKVVPVHNMKAYREKISISRHPLNRAIDGGDWLASRPGHFPLGAGGNLCLLNSSMSKTQNRPGPDCERRQGCYIVTQI